jgi:DNA-binding transcriptional regulator YiaG
VAKRIDPLYGEPYSGGVPTDNPYAEPDAALRDAQEAYLAALRADPDPQRSLVTARALAVRTREFAKTLMSVVGSRAVEIRDREKLTLAKLAQRFGVSTPAAQQWVEEGKQAEQREDAHG